MVLRQDSLDLFIETPPVKDGGPIGGPGAGGVGGVKGEVHLKWDKVFQLSFPYLGEESVEGGKGEGPWLVFILV